MDFPDKQKSSEVPRGGSPLAGAWGCPPDISSSIKLDSSQTDNIPTDETDTDEETAKIAAFRGNSTIPSGERKSSTEGGSGRDQRYQRIKSFWMPWYRASRTILPIYLAVHLAFFLITCLAVLFVLKDFSSQTLNINARLH